MLSRLGGKQDAVLNGPEQPGRRIGVAGPPPGVPEVRDVASQPGHPGQHAPKWSGQQVADHWPATTRAAQPAGALIARVTANPHIGFPAEMASVQRQPYLPWDR